jgi:hypothetical protein
MDAIKPETGVSVPETAVFLRTMSKFASWIMVWGSDEAVLAFRNLMQASFHSAPPAVTMRVYADFYIAARRDMGYPDSKVTVNDFLGMRINDLYDLRSNYEFGALSLAELAAQHNWPIPWEQVPTS